MDSLQIKVAHWQKIKLIPNTPWKIRGYSRSAYRTGFYIPELDIMLDAGPQNFNKPSHILITHTHIDHIANLPLTMIGDEQGDHKFHIYAHNQAKNYIHNYIKAMFTLNAMQNIDPSKWYNFHGLNKENTPNFNIDIKGNKLEIQVFECDHGIPTISYGFSDIKNKLREDYLGLSGKEISSLKKNGIDITEPIKYRRFAYICDTSIDVFKLNREILFYPVIFIECTFIYPEELENAIKTKHIHWDQLRDYVIKFPKIHFILFHFSQRYRDSEISEFFDKEKENGILNIDWF